MNYTTLVTQSYTRMLTYNCKRKAIICVVADSEEAAKQLAEQQSHEELDQWDWEYWEDQRSSKEDRSYEDVQYAIIRD